jgi:hypothetical protein
MYDASGYQAGQQTLDLLKKGIDWV